MTKSESIKELTIALNLFQTEIENVKKTSDNPYFKSKYAKLEDVLNEYRPIWTKHGLVVTQSPCSDDNGRVGVITTIFHTSGEYKVSDPFYLQLSKIDPQGAGSAITYARRYSLAAELGIQQEDDDGETHRKPDGKQEKEAPKQTAKKAEPKKADSPIDLKQRKLQTILSNLFGKKVEGFNTAELVKKFLQDYLLVDRISACLDPDLLDNAITFTEQVEANNG